jgi:nitrogen fixation/metabolism regulation signal transduction histidine kinase
MVKELKRAQEELKIAERETAWRDIARQVAHEIKNPLTPMKLAMQHLYASYTSGSQNFKLILASTNKMIIDQVETLNKIATEFSDFAKMPGKNYELFNTNEILKDAVQLMNSRKNIELNFSENGTNNIWGDKDELKRAFINILKNSLQAIEDNDDEKKKGRIFVSSERENGNCRILIKDNGCGMDKKTMSKLFEPYFSTKSSGMGLGLVITKKILDDMKAKIYVKSESGKGTEVEILFKVR